MRSTSVSVSSATAPNNVSSWIPVDSSQAAFGIGFNVDLDSTASGITFKVEHTFDDLALLKVATIARSGTTVTVTTSAAHGLNTGDAVVILNANQNTRASGLDGQYTIAVSSSTVFTYTSSVSGTVNTTTPVINYVGLRVQTNSSVSGNTSSVDGNYAFPVKAIRLNVTAWTAGTATLTVVQGRK